MKTAPHPLANNGSSLAVCLRGPEMDFHNVLLKKSFSVCACVRGSDQIVVVVVVVVVGVMAARITEIKCSWRRNVHSLQTSWSWAEVLLAFKAASNNKQQFRIKV